MGVFRNPANTKTAEIEARSIMLRNAYMQYRLLWELAPISATLENLLKIDNAANLTLNELAQCYTAKLITVKLNIKLSIVINTSKQYQEFMHRNAMNDLALKLGLELTDADFKKPDGSIISDNKEIAEMFLRTKIMPAMFTHQWKQNETGAILLSAILIASLFPVYAIPAITPNEIIIITCLILMSVMLLAYTMNAHQQGQNLMHQQGSTNRMEVDNEIRELKNKAEELSINEKAKLEAEKNKSAAPTKKLTIQAAGATGTKPNPDSTRVVKSLKSFFKF